MVAAHFSFKEDSNEGKNEIVVFGRWVEKECERKENLSTASHIIPPKAHS